MRTRLSEDHPPSVLLARSPMPSNSLASCKFWSEVTLRREEQSRFHEVPNARSRCLEISLLAVSLLSWSLWCSFLSLRLLLSLLCTSQLCKLEREKWRKRRRRLAVILPCDCSDSFSLQTNAVAFSPKMTAGLCFFQFDWLSCTRLRQCTHTSNAAKCLPTQRRRRRRKRNHSISRTVWATRLFTPPLFRQQQRNLEKGKQYWPRNHKVE